jgi:hypothetical protein
MSGDPPVSRIDGAKQATTPTVEDDTMIHAMPPESFLRHQVQETARIVERFQLRLFAVGRKQRGQRSRSTVGA